MEQIKRLKDRGKVQKRVITLDEDDIFNTIFTKGTKANNAIKRKKVKDDAPSSPAIPAAGRRPPLPSFNRRMTRKAGGGGHTSDLDINLIL